MKDYSGESVECEEIVFPEIIQDCEVSELKRKIQVLEAGLKAVESLINESHGVDGLHLNGDCAPWEEIRQGGRFESWLVDFDIALAEIQKS